MTNQEIQAVRERIRWTEKGAYSDYQVSSYYRQDVPKLLDEVERLQKELDDAAKVADEWQDRGREYKKERDEWKEEAGRLSEENEQLRKTADLYYWQIKGLQEGDE